MTPARLADRRKKIEAEHVERRYFYGAECSCGECLPCVVLAGELAWLDGVERLRAELAETTHALEVTGEKLTAVRAQRDSAEQERDAARGVATGRAELADQMRTERDDAQRAAAVLQSAADETARRINTALTTAADLHEFNSPEGDHLDGCPGCRLEAELGPARPDPRLEALEALATRYPAAFEWLLADAKARATRKKEGQ